MREQRDKTCRDRMIRLCFADYCPLPPYPCKSAFTNR
jgi:hypothetical protein